MTLKKVSAELKVECGCKMTTKASTYVDMSGRSSKELFEPWFLDMDEHEANRVLIEAALRNQGNFCVRRSSTPNCYAISYRLGNGSLKKYSIVNTKGMYVLELDKRPPPMHSLKEIVDYFKRECSGSIPICKYSLTYSTKLTIDDDDGGSGGGGGGGGGGGDGVGGGVTNKSRASPRESSNRCSSNKPTYINDPIKPPNRLPPLYINQPHQATIDHQKPPPPPPPRLPARSQSVTSPTSPPFRPPLLLEKEEKDDDDYVMQDRFDEDYQNAGHENGVRRHINTRRKPGLE